MKSLFHLNTTQLHFTEMNELYRVIKKISVHLMITIQKVTRNVQSVPRQSPDIY